MSSKSDEYVGERLRAWRRRTDLGLLLLAIGSLPILLLDLKRNELGRTDQIFLDAVDFVLLAAFGCDYIVEFYLSTNRRRYVQKEWTSLVIVLSQALMLLPGLVGLGVLRIFRAGRAFRPVIVIARSVAIGGAGAKEGKAILRQHAAGFALGVAGLTWISSAVGFVFAENVHEGARVESFGDALWWSISTITTVGYGDVYPVTFLGRVIGGFTMLVGIGAVAVVTARVASFLLNMENRLGASGSIPDRLVIESELPKNNNPHE